MSLQAPAAPLPLPTRALLLVWVTVMLVGGALLVLKHKVPLPEAGAPLPAVAAAIGRTRAGGENGQWLAVHVLYEKCGCSARVLDALLKHPADKGVSERIVFVTDEGASPDLGRRARDLGYGFVAIPRDRLVQEYRLEAAPVLAILSPTNELRYLGGYTPRKRGPVLEDRNIIAKTLAGQQVPPLPTLGCAVGRRLAARTNPLNL